jgi:AAA+ ATPase superfamily predicted ATPase
MRNTVAFFNRVAELNTLKRSLSSNQAELVIVYGRRGSGKSELLIQAIADHHALYYQATTELLPQQLVDLTNELRRVADQQGVALVGHFASLGDLFAAMGSLAQSIPHQPFIIVIDEFPYLAEADPATETVMQKWWDSISRTTPNIKVFLAGSHVSWMREHTLSEHGPLQNRRTRQIEVLPLDYQHAAEFYPDWSSQDKIRAYSIWGGLPGYVREINPALGLWDAISQTILDPNARLFVEPDWLRFTDLRADRLYTSLVRAMAMGKSTPGDIAKEVGRHSAADIFDPLNRLVDLGIVARVTALTTHGERRSRSRYHIADPFLAFWYRFIDSRRSMLRRGQTTIALAQIKDEIDGYISQYVFEEICREWIWIALQRGLLPCDLDIAEVGSWWGGTKDEQDEIDVVALSSRREAVLFGECKWSNSPMDMRDLGGLRHAIEMSRRDFDPLLTPWRLCFSRSGFHPDLVAEASHPENRIFLIDADRLYFKDINS